ncbi:MAG: cupin domain-containing protein, partial [Halobacteriaceae archaeon]
IESIFDIALRRLSIENTNMPPDQSGDISEDVPTKTERTVLESLSEKPHAEIFDQRQPRVVKLTLDADERVPAHQHPAKNIVLYLLSGTLELRLGDNNHELQSGEAIRFDGNQDIEPQAIDSCVALLVLAEKE